MSDAVTLGGLKRISHIPDRDGIQGRVIGGQDYDNVYIVGGSVTGISDVAVADGGTGASTVASARNNLGISDANTIVMFGDSLTSNEWQTTTTGGNTTLANIRAHAPFNRYNIKARQPFVVIDNKGTAGNTTTEMLNRFDADVAPLLARWMYFLGGRNDPYNSILPETTIANITAIFSKAREVGMKIIACTIPPANGFNQTYVTHHCTVNAWLREYCRRNDIYLIDYARLLMDTTSTTTVLAFDANNNYFYDDSHPNALGAGLLADQIAEKLELIIPEGDVNFDANRSGASGDLICFTNNPLMFQGAGGTAGTNASGTVPEGWSLGMSGTGNIAAVSSIVSRSDIYSDRIPGYLAKIDLSSSTANSEIMSFSQSISSGTRAVDVNGWYVMEAEIYATAGTGTIQQLSCGWQTFGASTNVAATANQVDASAGYLEVATFSGIIRSRPIKVLAAPTSILTFVNMATSSGGTATVWLGYVGLRKLQVT